MSTLSNARLGSANAYDTAVNNITSRQSALSTLQEQLSSGKRVVRASDDPTSAAIAERALTRISRIATDQRALTSQVSSITQAESALGDVTDALQRFRELTVSAGNGAYSTAERKSVAIELQGLRDQIFALSNTKDSNGLPLFSALGSALTPFVSPQQAAAPDYTFNGLPGQMASTAVSVPFALDGNSAFMLTSTQAYTVAANTTPTSTLTNSQVTISNPSALTGDTYTVTVTGIDLASSPGNTLLSYDVTGTVSGTTSYTSIPYATGQTVAVNGLSGLSMNLTGNPVLGDSFTVTPGPSVSLFNVLDTAIQSIGNAPDSNTAGQAVSQALGDIDLGLAKVGAIRSQAGELLNRADRISGNQDKRSIQMEADRSRAEDLDMVKGISDFQKQQTGYQVAMQTYAQIQKLSLFDFIR
jgi:flagellar hook-associated protein 3 FlgL